MTTTQPSSNLPLLLVLLLLFVGFTTLTTITALQYQTLAPNQIQSFTIAKPKSDSGASLAPPTYLFFRVTVPSSQDLNSDDDDHAYSMLTVSACTGLVQLHMSQCTHTQSKNCDDGKSEKWFPTENGANRTIYPVYNSYDEKRQEMVVVAQPDVSFGKLAMRTTTLNGAQYASNNVSSELVTYFFGVQIMDWDNVRNEAKFTVLLQYFTPNHIGMADSYLMLRKLRAAKLGPSLSLTWKRAVYCYEVESESHANNCTDYADLESASSYTVYIKRVSGSPKVPIRSDINMGTVCGLKELNNRDKMNTGTANSATMPILFDGSRYIVTVALHISPEYGPDAPMDVAYEPFVYNTTPDGTSGGKAAFIAVLVLVALGVLATLIGSFVIAQYYVVQKRKKEAVSMNYENNDASCSTDQDSYGAL